MEEKLVKHSRRPPVDVIVAAVKGTGGIQTKIAEKLGVCRQTVAAYIGDYPEVAEAVRTETERVLDVVESKLIENAFAGDMSAVTFYLRCKGRGRGYNDRVESHISGNLGVASAPSIEEIAKARQGILDAVKGDV